MNLSLHYACGPNNTISVADAEGIYLGQVCYDPFGMLCFEQYRPLHNTGVKELKTVLYLLQEYLRNR